MLMVSKSLHIKKIHIYVHLFRPIIQAGFNIDIQYPDETILNYLAPGGGCEVLFSSVCPANILVFYFSAIRRYRSEIYTGHLYGCTQFTKIDLHRSRVKVTWTVSCFLKVQSYHKNWAIEKFHFFSWTPLWILYSMKE